jgi:hypothetical protein
MDQAFSGKKYRGLLFSSAGLSGILDYQLMG